MSSLTDRRICRRCGKKDDVLVDLFSDLPYTVADRNELLSTMTGPMPQVSTDTAGLPRLPSGARMMPAPPVVAGGRHRVLDHQP